MADESHPLRRLLARPASRRAFLAGSGLAVAAACSSGGDESTGTGNGTEQADAPIQGGPVSGDVYVADDLRFPFGVLRDTGEGFGAVVGDPVTIGFRGPGEHSIAPRMAAFRNEGLEGQEREGIYTVQASFPAAGFWEAVLDVQGEEGSFNFEVAEEPRQLAPGAAAVDTPSPTPEATLGVDPICTRTPPCPLHEVSLDAALAEGRPVAVLFSTPALCQSRWCGPVLEVLLENRGTHEEAVRLIHVEIFKDLDSGELAPTVAEWALVSEPVFYGIDPTGTIVARLDGAFDAAEIDGFLTEVAGSA